MLDMLAMLALLVMLAATPVQPNAIPEDVDNRLADTDLILAFVINRHGDRTPDSEEVELFPNWKTGNDRFFPYGLKALTNEGKRRAYKVGQFLRQRYDGFISSTYLPGELEVRCTDYDRTKMTALAAMAALYPPDKLQKWNPALDWQPVPYSMEPAETCEFLYWYNCPAYLKLRNEVYRSAKVAPRIQKYNKIFKKLSNCTGHDISTPEDAFYLDNLYQAEENVGVSPPACFLELLPVVKEITKLEFEIEFYTDKMVQLASGVTLKMILDTMQRAVAGLPVLPKLRVYSTHENNVAALMAATNTFYPHQPAYGATYVLELRRVKSTGAYVVAAAYSTPAGSPARPLPISGCGNDEAALCYYDDFVTLTSNYTLNTQEHRARCKP